MCMAQGIYIFPCSPSAESHPYWIASESPEFWAKYTSLRLFGMIAADRKAHIKVGYAQKTRKLVVIEINRKVQGIEVY